MRWSPAWSTAGHPRGRTGVLRGLVLGLLVVEPGQIQHADVITQAVVVTVTLSHVLHSLTTPMGIRLVTDRGEAPATTP